MTHQALDFVYYFLLVAEMEKGKEHEDVGNIKMADFIEISRRIRDINNE